MMQEWRGEFEHKEWSDRFVWLNPSDINVDGSELHWKKISPADAKESFQVINRMEPFLRQAQIKTLADIRTWRERLANLAENGKPVFNERELRFFDLYYGSDRIRVEKYDGKYDVTNGRHRLWLAAQDGIICIPVSLLEKTTNQPVVRGYEEKIMSSIEFDDLDSEAQEQQEQAEDLNRQIEQHEKRVEKWAEASQELKKLKDGISSDTLARAEESAEKGKAETEKKLSELNEQREQLMERNQEITEQIHEAIEERNEALGNIDSLDIASDDASGEEQSFLRGVKDSLTNDMGKFVELNYRLDKTREILEKR